MCPEPLLQPAYTPPPPPPPPPPPSLPPRALLSPAASHETSRSCREPLPRGRPVGFGLPVDPVGRLAL